MKRAMFGVWLVLAAWATGCGGGTTCKVDTDCASGFACEVSSGKCVARPGGSTGSTGQETASSSATAASSSAGSTASSSTSSGTASTGTTTTSGSTGASSTVTGSTGSTSTATASTGSTASASSSTGTSSSGTTSTGSTSTGTTSTGSSSGTTGATYSVSVVTGDQQTALINQPLAAPIIVKVTAGGAAAAGVAVTVTAPPGVAVNPASGSTDAQGRFSTAVTLGRQPGSGNLLFAAGGASTPVGFSANAPPAGTVYPVLNAAYNHVCCGGPGPATGVAEADVKGLAVASDGTIYYSSTAQIRAVSPAGVMSYFAGTGAQSGVGGEGVDALSGPLLQPGALLLDEPNHLLYVSEVGNNRVRVIDLQSHLISTFAGGGAGGDGQLATQASLSNPGELSLMADGSLLIDDRGNNRIRRVDPNGIIHAWVGFTSCTADGQPLNGAAPLAEASGQAFILGNICQVGGGYQPGITRRDADGGLTRVVGGPPFQGTEGVPAAASDTGGVSALAEDAAGNLYFSTGDNRLRRVDAASTQLTTIAGTANTGSTTPAGDFGPAKSAVLAVPGAIAFGADGTLYFADTATGAIRAIAGAGNTVASSVGLSVSGGDAQSVYDLQTTPAPAAVTLVDGSGQPLSGFNVTWSAVTPGGIVAGSSKTAAGGVAQQLLEPGLLAGVYAFKASVSDLRGNEAASGQLGVTASDPPAGTLFSVANSGAIFAGGYFGLPYAGPASPLPLNIDGATAGDADSVYFHDQISGFVYQMGADGQITPVAGLAHVRTTTGDGLAPLSAGFGNVYGGMFYEHNSHTLYYGTSTTGDSSGAFIIRAIDFTNNVVTTVAGGGASTANGVPATTAQLDPQGPPSYQRFAVTSDKSIFVVVPGLNGSPSLLRKVSPTDGTISTVLTGASQNSCPQSNSTVANFLGTGIWTDSSDNVYFFASVCPAVNASYNAIGRLTPSGAFSVVVGGPQPQFNGCNFPNTGDGLPASSVNLLNPEGGVMLPNGDLAWFDQTICPTQHARLRKIDHVTGKVVTIGGVADQSATTLANYVPAATTPFNFDYILSMSATSSGHVVLNTWLNNQTDAAMYFVW